MERFSGRPPALWRESALVLLCCAALSVAALAFFFSRGYILYFGDAEAHLNIARRIVDSRTPGPDQIGTVWLPLPHLLTLLFVGNDAWWRNGLAGAFPSAAAFVAACILLYASAARLFGARMAAITAAGAFALNPNILYLQSAPMTESVFFAALFGVLYSVVLFAQTGSGWAILMAAVFSNAASMTRYEGWFLIPFVALYFLIKTGPRRWWMALLFALLAGLGPLAWLAHNWWHYSNPFEFYSGPYSAKAIYERALKAGGAKAPGDQNWRQAVQYFWAAARLCAGTPLAWAGLMGALAGICLKRSWLWLLLGLPPLFYIWSIHSSGANIFVPHLWPHSYYNTRYGTTLIPILAFGVAALVALAPRRFQLAAGCFVIAICVVPWLIGGAEVNDWVVWKESQVNSDSRRAWTSVAAQYLRQNYKAGQGIVTSFGDLTGIFRTAGIPLRETLHDGNNPYWNAATERADLFLFEEWAVTFSGDTVATAIQRANRLRPLYDLVARVEVPKAPVIEIYRRAGGHGAMEGLCRRNLIENCDAPEVPGAGNEPEDEQ